MRECKNGSGDSLMWWGPISASTKVWISSCCPMLNKITEHQSWYNVQVISIVRVIVLFAWHPMQNHISFFVYFTMHLRGRLTFINRKSSTKFMVGNPFHRLTGLPILGEIKNIWNRKPLAQLWKNMYLIMVFEM